MPPHFCRVSESRRVGEVLGVGGGLAVGVGVGGGSEGGGSGGRCAEYRGD